jgi:class 3 adenylate cyclase
MTFVAHRGGVLTILFTDLVDSTAQRVRIGDRPADSLRREHDEIVARAVAGNGGEVVKGLGDGAMCAFASPTSALEAAVAIAHALVVRNDDVDEQIVVRMGVSLGEVDADAGDLHGLAVNEAARLCSAAGPGEVLVADVVRAVAASRTTFAFVDRGPMQLKGLPEQSVVWQLEVPEPVAATWPVPEPLRPRNTVALSGRDVELAAGLDTWMSARAGERRIALISGEPGIGKTRLAAEIAQAAHEDGALVLFGRSDEGLAMPFQPFVEALDWYCDHGGPHARIGRYGADLTRLSTRVAERFPTTDPPLEADPASEQHRLFEAVTSWLGDVACPVVLVLDDLHWATTGSLLMMRHVIREARDVPLLVLATYRDTELDAGHPLVAALAEVGREEGVHRLPLSGLDDTGIVELLAAMSDQPADDASHELAVVLASQTDGNPFFIREVVRQLVDDGQLARRNGRWEPTVPSDAMGIPAGVRDAIRRRLDRLGAPTVDHLQVAAVVGREFDLSVLADVVGGDEREVLASIEAARTAGLVEELDIRRCRFSHALVQSVLVDEVIGARRCRLHRDVAARLEQDRDAPLAVVASHWLKAGPSGDFERTIRAVLAAAADADRRGDFDEAVSVIEESIRYAEDFEVPPDVDRELRVSLGEAQQRAGVRSARDNLLSVARVAAAAGDGPRLGRAMSASTSWFVGDLLRVDDEHLQLLQDAVGMIPDSALRSRLMSRLATEHSSLDPDFARSTIRGALEIARRIDDPVARLDVLVPYQTLNWCDPSAEDVLLGEIDQIAAALPTRDRWTEGVVTGVIGFTRGDPVLAQAGWTAVQEAMDGRVIAHQRHSALLRSACLTHFAGRLDEASQINAQQRDFAEQIGREDAIAFWVVVDFAIARDEGRVIELVETVRFLAQLADDAALSAYATGVLTLACAEGDRPGEAAALLAIASEAGFPYSMTGTNLSMTYAANYAEAAAATKDVVAAGLLRSRLDRYSGRIVYDQVASHGAVDRLLGRLAVVTGDFDAAAVHLEAARQQHERIGAPLFLARTLADLGELEIARGGDLEAASSLVAQAVEIARSLNAAGVEAYARRVIA